MPEPQGARIPAPRVHPPHAAKAMSNQQMIPDGLLLVEVTNKACERALRPAVVQRKVTDNDRAMWAAEGEAAIRPVVDTTHLTSEASVFGIVLRAVTA